MKKTNAIMSLMHYANIISPLAHNVSIGESVRIFS